MHPMYGIDIQRQTRIGQFDFGFLGRQTTQTGNRDLSASEGELEGDDGKQTKGRAQRTQEYDQLANPQGPLRQGRHRVPRS